MNNGMRKIFIALSAVVLSLAVSASALAYEVYAKQAESPMVRRLAGAFHLSAARVGNGSVGYADYLIQLDALRAYLAGPAAQALGIPNALTPTNRMNALDRAIRITAVEQFAKERAIVVTPLDVDRAYDYVRQPEGATTTREEFQAYIRNAIGWEEPQFKQYIIRPALLEDLLKKKALEETKDATAFDKELADRLAGKDVVKYLKF